MSLRVSFISVEIVIKTNQSCDALIDWVNGKGEYASKVAWDTHQWYAYWAPLIRKKRKGTKNDSSYNSVNHALNACCELIHKLPAGAREAWDNAEIRELNIGYHVASPDAAYSSYIETFPFAILQAITGLKAELKFTLYHIKEDE